MLCAQNYKFYYVFLRHLEGTHEATVLPNFHSNREHARHMENTRVHMTRVLPIKAQNDCQLDTRRVHMDTRVVHMTRVLPMRRLEHVKKKHLERVVLST